MPALENPRHETFCQVYVKSKSGKQAAREAGFGGGKDGNNWSVRASELLKRPYIKKRIDELNQALVKAATKSAKLDRTWVLERLKENADEALQNRDRQAANRALELLGKEMGMFVDRKMVVYGPLDSLDARQLQRLLGLAEAIEQGQLVLPKPDPINSSASSGDVEIIDVSPVVYPDPVPVEVQAEVLELSEDDEEGVDPLS